MPTLHSVLSACCSCITMICAAGAAGQEYPIKPIRIVAPAVGGIADVTARVIAQGISAPLGQPVIVDNRSSGIVAAEAVSRAAADGYTIMTAGGTFFTVTLFQKAPYDPVKDFSPITIAIRAPNILVVHPSLPANSVKALIALAKARPGVVNYATGGTGSPQHLAGEMFKSMGGVDIVRVAYKGGAAALSDLIAGEVQMAIDDAPTLLPSIKAGKLRALAVTTSEPSTLLPGLPTLSGSGLAGYESATVTGLYAPAKTPASIVQQLNQEILRVLRRQDVREKFFNAATEVVGNSPEEFAAYIASVRNRVGKLIKDVRIKVES